MSMAENGAARPLVLVTVGTDHHPFPRLMGWIERYAASGPRLRWLVQHGYTPAPVGRGVVAHELLPHHELQEALREAAVVVCQGGPGSIMDARGAGKVPVVVPRRSDLGEHVDDHQLRFSRRVAADGLIRLAEDEDDFRTLVAAALERPERFAAQPEVSDLPQTIERFGVLVEELMTKPTRRSLLPLRRRAQP
ncbi:glycosyltransferase [Streptomyces sp. 6N223]|uniref:glycosyltransferase n=1 Tax=Streptomyces sp. 6N223 TaxID=3457412 RepID=UPI003FD4B4A1